MQWNKKNGAFQPDSRNILAKKNRRLMSVRVYMMTHKVRKVGESEDIA